MPYRHIKSILDTTIAATALAFLLPFGIPIGILLRLTGEGEVFYRQRRIGYQNRPFGIWKFATMLKNSPNMGTGSLTLRNDPRVTSIGRWLRITKLNELPQLINVLAGDMSFVGPRPQMEIDFRAYPPSVQEKIYRCKPGITGIGSIVFRDEEKLLTQSGIPARDFYEKKIAPYKGELELWYLKNRNIRTDLLLLCLTLWVVIRPDAWKRAYRLFPDLPEAPDFLS